VRRDAKKVSDKDNVLKSKTTRDRHPCLQPGKRLKTRLPYEGGFQK